MMPLLPLLEQQELSYPAAVPVTASSDTAAAAILNNIVINDR